MAYGTTTMVQDIKLFGATRILLMSLRRAFVLCTTSQRVVQLDATTGKVSAYVDFQAPVGAFALTSYNTYNDTGYLWVSLTDGTLWAVPVAFGGIFAAPSQVPLGGNKIDSSWMTAWGGIGNVIIVPSKNGGVLYIDNAFIITSLEGVVGGSKCTFGIGLQGGPLYLFDSYANGYQFEQPYGYAPTCDGSWAIPGGENITDGTISSASLSLLCGARSTVQTYALSTPSLPTLVSRRDYDRLALTVTGLFDTAGNVTTLQEYAPVGLSAWFPTTGGRDTANLSTQQGIGYDSIGITLTVGGSSVAVNRFVLHGPTARLQFIKFSAQTGIGFDIIGSTLKVG
jgi:hypothetical protein